MDYRDTRVQVHKTVRAFPTVSTGQVAVALFQQIALASDLPPVGVQAERNTLDIKKDYKTCEQFEFGKDMAALANATGGVILVGAVEDDERGTVKEYSPLSDQRAKTLRNTFSEALRDRCFPAPLVNAEIIPKDHGFVLAVNIWPYPSQAVGVMTQGKGPPAYAFPLRVGVDTKWLRPEQLPMLMIPELRRVMILLDQIPTGAIVKVVGRSASRVTTFDFIEVRMLENILQLRYRRQANDRDAERPEFHLPLDAIQSVWQDADNGWRILVKGEISSTGNGSAIFTTGTF